MTRPAPWAVGLSGSKYLAATLLHDAARQPAEPKRLARALIDAHTSGLDRTQIAAILHAANPSLPPSTLTAAGRYPRGIDTTRASFDLDDPAPTTPDDGPGEWPPYLEVLAELRARIDQRTLTAHQAIRAARQLAPAQDLALAATLCAAILTGRCTDQPDLDDYRRELVLGIWDRAA